MKDEGKGYSEKYILCYHANEVFEASLTIPCPNVNEQKRGPFEEMREAKENIQCLCNIQEMQWCFSGKLGAREKKMTNFSLAVKMRKFRMWECQDNG